MSTRCFASRSLVTGVLMSVMLMSTGGPLSAQETVQNGAVFGTITDQTGASLPGVTVDVSSPSLQGKQSAVTDGQGAYPRNNPVTPADVHATVFAALGYDAQRITYLSPEGRPFPLSSGAPIRQILS